MRCTRTRGKKGEPHLDPDDPPRRRANKARGHGTWENDRPPVAAVVGRESAEIRPTVLHNSARKDLEPEVLGATRPGTVVNTDEWGAYNRLSGSGRGHVTVCHKTREWARDDDGDGIREVHTNTIEGIWTGLRNFLRTFRGVNKKYLQQYVAIFAWGHNEKRASVRFLRALLGVEAPAPA